MISRTLSYIRVSVFVDSYSILHRIVCLASMYSEITIFNINEAIIHAIEKLYQRASISRYINRILDIYYIRSFEIFDIVVETRPYDSYRKYRVSVLA